MERKVGSKFKFGDTVLKVIEREKEPYCYGCFFCGHDLLCSKSSICDLIGDCIYFSRSDKKMLFLKK